MLPAAATTAVVTVTTVVTPVMLIVAVLVRRIAMVQVHMSISVSQQPCNMAPHIAGLH